MWNTSQISALRRWLYVKVSTRGRQRQIALGVLIAVIAGVAGLLTWTLWPDPPRQREYVNASACLLTDTKGVAAEPAKAVWAALQEASTVTLVRVQYLPVSGPQTAENAEPYLNSLAMSHCGMIIAAGQAQIDAVTRNAAEFPTVRFVTVNGGAASGSVRMLDASSPENLRAELQKQLESLAEAAS